MKIQLQSILFFLLLITCVSFSQTVVNNNTQLYSAIENATAGSVIVLANGTWQSTKISISKNATATNPIIIKAETPNQVFFEGDSNVSLGGNYIYFEGVVFRNASNLISDNNRIEPVIEFRDSSNNVCNNCKVSNIKIENYNGTSAQEEDVFKWIILYGQYNEISHSSFIGKHGVGSIINDNRNDGLANYHKIHHNYFASRTPVGEVNALNDQDAIRIGNSSTSLSNSFTEVYNNFFYDWSGEVEIISNKSGKNKYYNNTFRAYQGTLTLRHGDHCEVYNNYFFANNNLLSGGIRVIGENHKIFNNYIEGVNSIKPDGSRTNTAGAINISNGKPNAALNEYYQVKNATIVNNTFVNCDYGFRIGTQVKSDLTLAPENIILANNIMLNTSINAFDIQTNATGSSKYEGNLTQNGSWDLTNNSNNNRTVSLDLLEQASDFYRLKIGSPAIDASFGNYTFLNEDILGSTRNTIADAGAEEFGGVGINLPYTIADVGLKVGFLSSLEAFLNVSKSTLNFNINEGTIEFEISSDVDWTISSNQNWLSTNTTTGSNNGTIYVSVLQNNSGLFRTATLTVSQVDGTLEETITINQSNQMFSVNDAVEITGISVSGIGTQEGGVHIPENTLDRDFTTRWSANSTNGSAYLTYDLGCQKIVTAVKIYFHKGSTRTSSFKIETSLDGVNFTNTSAVLTSSGITDGFEDFLFSPFREVQYIRILGFGNSEGSGWNSYEEVQIFGNTSCASLNISENSFKEMGITIFPVPIKNGFLNIASKDKNIGFVEIFDVSGRKVLTTKINTEKGEIQLNTFAKGIYIIKIDETFRRFLVE